MSTESPREKIRKLARGKNGFGFCCSAMICMKREGTQATRELIRKHREEKDFERATKRSLKLTEEEREKQRADSKKGPVFSIAVPLYNTPEDFLREMVRSVCGQSWERWELLLADGSDDGVDRERIVRDAAEFEKDKMGQKEPSLPSHWRQPAKCPPSHEGKAGQKEPSPPSQTGQKEPSLPSHEESEMGQKEPSLPSHEESKTGRKEPSLPSRFRYRKLEENGGISRNSNAALEMAEGEFIVLLDHDDLLIPSALWEIGRAIRETGADFLYSDEAVFASPEPEKILEIHRKAEYNQEALLRSNYICHVTAFRRELLRRTGGFREEYDGSQDHDLFLRLTDAAEKVVHIPKALYFWRSHEGSVAGSIRAKDYAVDAGQRAVRDFLRERKGIKAEVVSSEECETIYEIRVIEEGRKDNGR